MWTPEGKKPKKMLREDWHVFIKDHHASYISFEEFEANEQNITENRLDTKCKREKTPPREGPSLLQGLVYCGKCGCSMRVNYQYCAGQLAPIYRCDQELHNYRGKLCQSIPGLMIDRKISELLVERLTPDAVEQAISVQRELDNRQSETLTFFSNACQQALLNQEGYKSGKGLTFSNINVRSIMRLYSIPNKKKRYIDRGYITTAEKAAIMGISPFKLYKLISSGKYQGEYVSVNTKNELLFPLE